MSSKPLTGPDIVIYRDGKDWGFHLPDQHTATLMPNNQAVLLSTPDRGAEHTLHRIEEAGDETHLYVGAPTGNSHGLYDLETTYPFPNFQDEVARLKNRWEQAGGGPAGFNAWGAGETHDQYLTRRRADIRKLERRSSDSTG